MVVLNMDTSNLMVNEYLEQILDIISGNDGDIKCIIVKFDCEKAGL